jgi:hypothetical protein
VASKCAAATEEATLGFASTTEGEEGEGRRRKKERKKERRSTR